MRVSTGDTPSSGADARFDLKPARTGATELDRTRGPRGKTRAPGHFSVLRGFKKDGSQRAHGPRPFAPALARLTPLPPIRAQAERFPQRRQRGRLRRARTARSVLVYVTPSDVRRTPRLPGRRGTGARTARERFPFSRRNDENDVSRSPAFSGASAVRADTLRFPPLAPVLARVHPARRQTRR